MAGKITQVRTTYNSTQQEYNLDPKNVFDVVGELIKYAGLAKYNSEVMWPHNFTFVSFHGNGRNLILRTEAREPDNSILHSVDLAELTLSEDGKKLDFKVHPVERVVIDPSGLRDISERYKE